MRTKVRPRAPSEDTHPRSNRAKTGGARHGLCLCERRACLASCYERIPDHPAACPLGTWSAGCSSQTLASRPAVVESRAINCRAGSTFRGGFSKQTSARRQSLKKNLRQARSVPEACALPTAHRPLRLHSESPRIATSFALAARPYLSRCR